MTIALPPWRYFRIRTVWPWAGWYGAGMLLPRAAEAGRPLPLVAGGGWVWLLPWLLLALLALLAVLCLWHRQRRATTAMAQQLLQLRRVVEGVSSAVVVVNPAGEIEFVNSQTEKWFGYDRGELLGQPVEVLVPARLRAKHPELRAGFASAPRARPMGTGTELYGLRKDGSEFPIEIGLTPLQTEDGLQVLSSIVDISSRKRLEARFRQVVESSPNALVVVNQHGIVELVNAQAEVCFGYLREELIGQPIEQLIPQRFRGAHPGYRTSFLQDPQARPMGAGRELYGLRKNGSEFPIEIGLTPVQTEDGVLVLSSIIDISHRRESEQKLQAQAAQLATANRYKSEFLATMSHELRTPLNSILLLAEQLKSNALRNLTPKQVGHADIILRSGSDLLNLINDILDLSRIEAGRMTLSAAPLDLAGFSESLRQTFELQAENRGLLFTIALASDAPRRIVTDESRLFQIVKNLIANAFKFTEHGRVDVLIARAGGPATDDAEAQGPAISIAVCDDGPGIPLALQEHIFQAFYQTDSSSRRSHGGSGLGLTISRQLAELLGGSLNVRSRPGHGSVFTLLLPVGEPGAAEQAACGLLSGSQAARVVSQVLIVSDDEDYLQWLLQRAQTHGLQALPARSTDEAEAALRTVALDAIMLDLQLQDRSGLLLARELAAAPATSDIPIHILNSQDQPPKADAIQQLDALFRAITQRQPAANRYWLAVGRDPDWRSAVQALAAQYGEAVLWFSDLAEVEPQMAWLNAQLILAELNEDEGSLLLALLRHSPEGWPALLLLQDALSVATCTALRAQAVQVAPLAQWAAWIQAWQAAQPLQGPARNCEFAGKRLLLVDDDVRNTYSMCSQLDELGIEILVASNGVEALDAARQHPEIDLVLMDIAMPLMDGYEAIQRLQLEQNFHKPIVALTAYAMKGDREKCLAAGADDYLAKPVRLAELHAVLRRWL